MAQPPFLLDVLQIEPGSGQTITISRNVADNTMKFVDAVISGGITLPELVGLRNVTGLFIVGVGGDGSPYTTIQEALDAIPNSSDANSPSLVLVLPGVYQENLSIQKDGVFLIGLGATVLNDGASDTITISASTDVTPKNVTLSGLTIQNDQVAFACVKIIGADAFASGTVTVNAAPLATGDLVTINGVNLVGTAGNRTSGSDNFSVSGGTVDAIAAEIAAAINDPANSFAGLVTATSALGVVTIEAVTAGSGGNAITLTVTTVPAGNLTASGVTLAGGGSAGNDVALNQVLVQNCVLQATNAGGFQIVSDTANVVRVLGGTFLGSSLTSSCSVSNTAEFRLEGVAWANDVALSYDTGNDQPATLSCDYVLANVSRIGDTICDLVGLGSLSINGCADCGNLTVDGDQTVTAKSSNFDVVDLSGTIAVTTKGCSRGNLVNSGGTPTLAESMATGSTSFVASVSETVTFTVEQPDNSYRVLLESPDATVTLAVTNKLAASFDIVSSAALTGTVGYTVIR